MQKFLFHLEGEDHTLFAYEIEAEGINEAEFLIEELYPEARIRDCERI